MSKHTDRTATAQAAIRRARLRREINEALQVQKPPMTKEEAFRGFTDEDAHADYLRQKRDERNDSGV